MITPKQASDTLQVSTSTVRRWASDFEPFLGPRQGFKRLYSVDDLAVLKKIRDLYGKGLNTPQVKDALQVVDRSAADSALITIPDFAAALSQAQADQARLIVKVNELANQVQALQEYFGLPFHKRIFKRPPSIEKDTHEND